MNKQISILAIGLMLASTLLMMIPTQSYAQLFPIQMQLPNTAIQNQQQNPYLPPQPMSGMSTQDYMYLMQLMQQYMQLYGPYWQDRYWDNEQVIKIIDKDDDDDDDDNDDNDHDHKDHKKPWWWKDNNHKNGKGGDWKDHKNGKWWDKEKAAQEDAYCDNRKSKSCGNSDEEIEKDKNKDNNNNEEVEEEESDDQQQQQEEEHEEEQSDQEEEDNDSDDSGGDDGDDGGDSGDDGGDSGDDDGGGDSEEN